MKVLNGMGVSRGMAYGHAFVYKKSEFKFVSGVASDCEAEFGRIVESFRKAKEDLQKIAKGLSSRLNEVETAIFDAHIMMLEDPIMLAEIRDCIVSEGFRAEEALGQICQRYAAFFNSNESEYFRARANDVRDIESRIMSHLNGGSSLDLPEGCVLVCEELGAGDTLALTDKKVAGVIMKHGSLTSHVSIILKSLGIPTLVNVSGIEDVEDGMMTVVDCNGAQAIVEPDESTFKEYEELCVFLSDEKKELAAFRDKRSVTADGHFVELAANVSGVHELDRLLDSGAEAVGLFRSEFLFLSRNSAPDEEEQFAAYKAVLEANGNKRTVIRTMDIGGDKAADYLGLSKEDNPFLGLRAIRLCFAREDLFRVQLRALLRASAYGRLCIMFPMIASIRELRMAKAILASEHEALVKAGVTVGEYEVGMMVEVPSAALMADVLAKEVDFFSIGSNDLVQYCMAADRGNERVACLYRSLDPSVLRLIKLAIDGAHRAGKWCGLCGEMANDKASALLLMGLGIDELSLGFEGILPLRRFLSLHKYADLKQIASKALEKADEDGVLSLLKESL